MAKKYWQLPKCKHCGEWLDEDLSSSWFYHKMDGIDGNGGKGGFTESEALLLRGALIDLSERLRKAADEIK